MYTISIMEIQKPTYTLIGLYQPFPRFRVRVSRFRKKKKKKEPKNLKTGDKFERSFLIFAECLTAKMT